MSAKVAKLKLVNGVGPGVKIEANQVLVCAQGKLQTAVVLGYTPEGRIYAASSNGPAEMLWVIEQAKRWMLEGCPSDE